MARVGHARPVRPQILRGWVEFVESGDRNAAAGLAAATGDAPQPEATIAPNAGNAAATGAAQQPEATVAPNAGAASSTGTANQAIAHVQALAGVASATGEAFGVTSAVVEGGAPRPVVATAAAVQAATQRRWRQPTPTPIIFGAPLEEPTTQAPAGVAAATGTANQPTVQTSSEPTPTRTVVVTPTAHAVQVRRQQDTAAFVDLGAPIVVEDVNAPAGLAAATGTANTGKADIDAKPNTAEATGASTGQTVQTGTFANAPAGLAAATGTAGTASTTIRPNAAVGLAAGIANQPAAHVRPNAGVGSGTGTAPQPTVVFGAQAPAGLAAAVGTANTGLADIDVKAAVAAGLGEAFPTFGLVGNPLGPPQPIGAQDQPGLTARDGVGLIAVDDDHALEVLR